MSAHDSTQWFWSDWAGDQAVRRLTLAERGLWIDLLCLAAVGNPIGYVCDHKGDPLSYEEIAGFVRASPTEVESLIVGILEKGAASRDRTGRLFNRRMTRQAEKAAKKRLAGRLGGEQTRKSWKSLNALALSSGARANATAFATAPRSPPYQSNSKTTSVSDDAPREGSAGKGEVIASPQLIASLNKRKFSGW